MAWKTYFIVALRICCTCNREHLRFHNKLSELFFVSSIGIHNANTVQSLSVFHSRSTIKDSDFFETPQDPVKMSKAHPDRQMATNSDPPGETKMYRCDCGRKFSLLANLTYYSRWECGRIYDCPHCLKQYKSVSSFRRHLFTCERLLLEPSTTE